MPILTGFPPSNTISPGVRIAEQDNSFVASVQTFHRAGLVGFASKGPLNIPTLVTSVGDLHKKFGFPHPADGDPYLIYAAEQYLSVGSELYVMRVGLASSVSNEVAATATVDVPVAGVAIQVVSSTAGAYVFDADSFFRWKLNGVLASKTLVVPAGSYSADQLVTELNSQLDTLFDGIIFYKNTGNSHIAVETTFAYGPNATLEFVSVQNSIYGPAINELADDVMTTLHLAGQSGLGTGMTQAQDISGVDHYPNDGYHAAGHYTFATDTTLSVVVDGTDNTSIDNVVQVMTITAGSYTTAQLVTALNTQINLNGLDTTLLPGGFKAFASGNFVGFKTHHSGVDAQLLVKTSAAGAYLSFGGVTKAGTSPSGVTTDGGVATYGVITGASGSATTCFTLNADSPGIDGNGTQVIITNDLRENVFKMEVYNNGVQVESWGYLTKDAASSYYVGTFLSQVSNYIAVVDNTNTPAAPLAGTYSLTGGSDGIPSDPDDQDALLIGNSVGFTGIYALSEPEQIDIDLLAVPGHPSTAVVDALIDVCQNMRQDCLAIIDPPFGLTVEEITAWQNGTHPLNTERFDSDFAALYWPWVKIHDSFNVIDVWVPPSGAVMATIARSDSLSAPWFAPAGLNRGVVPNITDVFTRPSLSERDLMYGNSNAINPIITFPDLGGFVIWGQKTLHRLPTALDRINVRRLMFAVEKQLKRQCRGLLFDPDDAAFQAKFITIATKVLTNIKVGRGLTQFAILADDSLNTPDVKDRNEFRANIGIIPTFATEFIYLMFTLSNNENGLNTGF